MATIEEVKRYLTGHNIEVLEFEEDTPTAVTAARAVGCEVGQIAKTLLFIIGGKPVVVVTSGDVKVKGSLLKKAMEYTGKVRLPGGEEVFTHTGYRPGGVCPFLLPEGLPVVIDSSMRRFDLVYAAAGNDHSAVPVTVDGLASLLGAREASVCA